ncbi:hypothetical protein ACQEWB_25140 [Streptomyces sp. CA-249302]|uniref:hypothetical protein n=1 Tax=Streptomyces sp. CA-249302 TaxID=3240058 RepID=UPI003D8FC4A4
MRDKRSVLGLIGALAIALAALFLAGSAQAADGPAGKVMVLPVPAQKLAPAANAPTISPSVNTTHVAYGGTITCPSGNLCAGVQDPTTNSWKIFYLFTCAKYSVSYWNGDGHYADSQTGGVTSYFYGQSGNELTHFTPDGGVDHPYNWGPVWSIRNC